MHRSPRSGDPSLRGRPSRVGGRTLVARLLYRWPGPLVPVMAAPSGSDRRGGFPLRRTGLAGHHRPVTEDEAKAVAEFAARYVENAVHHLAPIIRYGRLFTPGADASGPDRTLEPFRGRGASRLAMDSGLLYAEGYVRLARASQPTGRGAWTARPSWSEGPACRSPRTSAWHCGRTTCDGSVRHGSATAPATTASPGCSSLVTK